MIGTIEVKNVRQSIDNLHETITRSVLYAQKQGSYGKVVNVIDPSPGLFGGNPIEGLVTVEYACPWEKSKCSVQHDHTHQALFGPEDEISRPSWEVETFTLYAD